MTLERLALLALRILLDSPGGRATSELLRALNAEQREIITSPEINRSLTYLVNEGRATRVAHELRGNVYFITAQGTAFAQQNPSNE